MIRSIRHKGLKRLYEDDDPRGVFVDHVAKLRDILSRLDAACTIRDTAHADEESSSPGGVVRRQCIEPLGLTITESAAALAVTRTALSELVNGKRGFLPKWP